MLLFVLETSYWWWLDVFCFAGLLRAGRCGGQTCKGSSARHSAKVKTWKYSKLPFSNFIVIRKTFPKPLPITNHSSNSNLSNNVISTNGNNT